MGLEPEVAAHWSVELGPLDGANMGPLVTPLAQGSPGPHMLSVAGTPPIVPVSAAIAHAIRDATGAEIHELPISREEMLRALEAAKERERRGAPAAV